MWTNSFSNPLTAAKMSDLEFQAFLLKNTFGEHLHILKINCVPGPQLRYPKIWTKKDLRPVHNKVINAWKTDTVDLPVSAV